MQILKSPITVINILVNGTSKDSSGDGPPESKWKQAISDGRGVDLGIFLAMVVGIIIILVIIVHLATHGSKESEQPHYSNPPTPADIAKWHQLLQEAIQKGKPPPPPPPGYHPQHHHHQHRRPHHEHSEQRNKGGVPSDLTTTLMVEQAEKVAGLRQWIVDNGGHMAYGTPDLPPSTQITPDGKYFTAHDWQESKTMSEFNLEGDGSLIPPPGSGGKGRGKGGYGGEKGGYRGEKGGYRGEKGGRRGRR